jgi:hypothetical protein
MRGGMTHVRQKFWMELAGKLQTQSVDVQLQSNQAAKVSVHRTLGKQITINMHYIT